MVNPEEVVIVNALVRQALVSAREEYVGLVGEAVRWATGAEYKIIETHRIAGGDKYCRFEIGEVIV